MTAAGIAAAAAAVTVLALVTRPDDPAVRVPATEPIPTPWQPAGTEFPIADLGPATDLPDLSVAALSRRIGVADHPDLLVYASLTYQAGSTATLFQCLAVDDGGSGCTPEWNPVDWSVSITSSIDNRQADFDLWTLDGLADEVAYVSYVDGARVLWARPVAGVVAFPDVAGIDEVVVGYGAAGVEIARYGRAEQAAQQALAGSVHAPLRADISQSEFEELGRLTRASLEACLTVSGGEVGSGGVTTFPEGVDQPAVWNRCVVEVKDVVGQAVSELVPRFYDPASERPENPDTPFSFGD